MAGAARIVTTALLAGVLAVGCASTGEVIVDVRTDFAPGRDFDSVVVTTPGSRVVAPAALTDWLAGVRIGPAPSPTGSQAIAVELQYRGVTLVRRTVRVVVSGTVVVPVWLVRACVEVSCPEPGRPLATECEGGRCVAPECVTTGTDCPTPVCALDGDCEPSPVACAANRCRDGHCVSVPVPDGCGPGTYCDPTRGCEVDRFDGGVPDAGSALDVGASLDVSGSLDTGLDAPPPVVTCSGACSDDDPCTRDDHCSDDGTSCIGTDLGCAAMGDACNSYACNGTGCVLTILEGAPCADDGDPCTDDRCGAGGSCRHLPGNENLDCGGGRICCDGRCTSFGSGDCGACGVTCGAGETCEGGRCTCGGTSAGTGSGRVCAGADPRCCGGTCVDTATDPYNCGACGARCGDQYGDCNGGTCSCGSDARCSGGGSICCRCGAGCAGSYCSAPGTCPGSCC